MVKTVKEVVVHKSAPAGGFYFLAYIGAAIHFVSASDGFGGFIWALIKAIFWPAYLINHIFDVLKVV